MKSNKTACFCAHIRAALACYVDMTPEQQALAAMYANRKITGLHTLRAAATSPGGECAAQLLQKMQQLDTGNQ
mgnify:FL=1|jgi:hypothetical protein